MIELKNVFASLTEERSAEDEARFEAARAKVAGLVDWRCGESVAADVKAALGLS